MKIAMRTMITSALIAMTANLVAGASESDTPENLASVLEHERRAEDRTRDRYRHPEETLLFFDIQPTHTVVEYAPGSGWYTRILAPYVAEQGRYIAVNFPGEAVPIERYRKALVGWDANTPANVEEMSGVPASEITAYFGNAIPEDADGTVDRILITRMLHNLLRWEIADQELLALRRMLKDDGLVGVVQHRAPADAAYSNTDGSKGYLHEADVIAMMELYGFELVAKSEINANPNDPANHEAGVWTLPPSFRLGDTDREKYAAIGESDRATLLFKKAD